MAFIKIFSFNQNVRWLQNKCVTYKIYAWKNIYLLPSKVILQEACITSTCSVTHTLACMNKYSICVNWHTSAAFITERQRIKIKLQTRRRTFACRRLGEETHFYLGRNVSGRADAASGRRSSRRGRQDARIHKYCSQSTLPVENNSGKLSRDCIVFSLTVSEMRPCKRTWDSPKWTEAVSEMYIIFPSGATTKMKPSSVCKQTTNSSLNDSCCTTFIFHCRYRNLPGVNEIPAPGQYCPRIWFDLHDPTPHPDLVESQKRCLSDGVFL